MKVCQLLTKNVHEVHIVIGELWRKMCADLNPRPAHKWSAPGPGNTRAGGGDGTRHRDHKYMAHKKTRSILSKLVLLARELLLICATLLARDLQLHLHVANFSLQPDDGAVCRLSVNARHSVYCHVMEVASSNSLHERRHESNSSKPHFLRDALLQLSHALCMRPLQSFL